MRKFIVIITALSFALFCGLLVFYVLVFRIGVIEPEGLRQRGYQSPGVAVTDAVLQSGEVLQGSEETLFLEESQAETEQDNQFEEQNTPAELPETARIRNVTHIPQHPELPRGCEVTALAVLLNFHGINADKMTLAEEIKKDGTPRRIIDGKVHWGDPNDGFIGDMYNLSRPGYGVYHAPVYELMQAYAGDRAVDLTGLDFDEIIWYIARGMPVWVITNATHAPLHETAFETWITPNGEVTITYREHAVIVTGYNQENIFIVDPLQGFTQTPKQQFKAAWEQMGSQALTVLPEE